MLLGHRILLVPQLKQTWCFPESTFCPFVPTSATRTSVKLLYLGSRCLRYLTRGPCIVGWWYLDVQLLDLDHRCLRTYCRNDGGVPSFVVDCCLVLSSRLFSFHSFCSWSMQCKRRKLTVLTQFLPLGL